MKLDDVADGKTVFADATVFVYHFTGASPACRRFLKRLERGKLRAITSAAAIAEVTHRLMMMEAVSRGLVAPPNVAKKLRGKPAHIKKLLLYQEQVEQIPLMGVEVLPVDLRVLVQAAAHRMRSGLTVNDSVMAATAISVGVEFFATSDRDFRRVPELTVAEPGDLAESSETRGIKKD